MSNEGQENNKCHNMRRGVCSEETADTHGQHQTLWKLYLDYRHICPRPPNHCTTHTHTHTHTPLPLDGSTTLCVFHDVCEIEVRSYVHVCVTDNFLRWLKVETRGVKRGWYLQCLRTHTHTHTVNISPSLRHVSPPSANAESWHIYLY